MRLNVRYKEGAMQKSTKTRVASGRIDKKPLA